MIDRSVLKSSIVTEKAAGIHEKDEKYTFRVTNDASKGQIKNAVESIYGVSVTDVNVLSVRDKTKRSWVGSRRKYSKKGYKKAVVKLKDGDKINLYEGGDK